MWPPSLFIGFRKRQALGKPNDDVIVQGAALLKLGHPYVVKAMTPAIQPLPDAFEKFGYVTRREPVNVPIGQGQHGRPHPDPTEDMFEKLGSYEDRTL